MNSVDGFNKYVEFRKNFIYVTNLRIAKMQELIEKVLKEHPDFESDPYYKKLVEDAESSIRNACNRKEMVESELTNEAFYNSMLDELLNERSAQNVERKGRLI